MRIGLSLSLSSSLLACAGGEGSRAESTEDTESSVGDSSSTAITDPTAPSTTLSDAETQGTVSSLTNADDGGGGGPVECGNGTLELGEECDDGNVEDADGCNADCTPSGSVLWEQTVGSGLGAVDDGFDVAADAEGNFTVVGYAAVAGGTVDGWIRRYSPMGGAYWTLAHAGAGAGDDTLWGVEIAADDSVYVAGRESAADMTNNGLLRKVDTFGADLWVSSFDAPSSNGDTVVQALALDGEGAVIVAGYYGTDAAGAELMLRKYMPDGTAVWTRSYGGAAGGNDAAYGVAATSSGDLYVVGYESVVAEGTNMWLGKYDTDGNLLWSRGANGTASLDDYFIGVVVDGDDNAYVCGYAGDVNFPWQIVLRRYDADGNIDWTEHYLGETMEGAHCSGLARAPSGDLVLAGGEIQATVRAALVRRYSAEGALRWSRTYPGGAAGPDYGRGVHVGDDETIYVAGSLDVGADLRDLWVARLSP